LSLSDRPNTTQIDILPLEGSDKEIDLAIVTQIGAHLTILKGMAINWICFVLLCGFND
jgi:hypothetical protein